MSLLPLPDNRHSFDMTDESVEASMTVADHGIYTSYTAHIGIGRTHIELVDSNLQHFGLLLDDLNHDYALLCSGAQSRVPTTDRLLVLDALGAYVDDDRLLEAADQVIAMLNGHRRLINAPPIDHLCLGRGACPDCADDELDAQARELEERAS